jgi:hypothetical protein
MTMAVCLTVIGERVVMVMRYQLADATPAEEARLMRDAEALATSITVTTPAEPTDGPG